MIDGRKMWALYRDAHAGDTGRVLVAFDNLPTEQRLVWERLGEAAHEMIYEELRERGVFWEPTS